MARAWSARESNPVSGLIYLLTWLIVVILVAGILLTWQNADAGNSLVHWDLIWARRLAGPFDNVFSGGGDPKVKVYENWALAAAAYYALGHLLSYLTRW